MRLSGAYLVDCKPQPFRIVPVPVASVFLIDQTYPLTQLNMQYPYHIYHIYHLYPIQTGDSLVDRFIF